MNLYNCGISSPLTATKKYVPRDIIAVRASLWFNVVDSIT